MSALDTDLTIPDYATREQWLEAAALILVGLLPPGDRRSALPATLKLSVGWPRGTRKAVGQCWAPTLSADGTSHHIFISPRLDDPVTVLAVLLHEIVHAYVGTEEKHVGAFLKTARALGFLAPFTKSIPSEGLAETLHTLGGALGYYPHSALNERLKEKQPTRMLLYECPEGVKIRHAGEDLNARCEDCGELFELKRKEPKL